MTTLSEVSLLCSKLRDIDSEIYKMNQELKSLQDQRRILSEESIPSSLQELGLSELKLDTGEKISIKSDIYASLSEANKRPALEWLIASGNGSLIKNTVTCLFEAGDNVRASALSNNLNARGVSASHNQTVHPQTLKAFLREQVSSGNSIPLELFNARPVFVASIKNT